MMRGSVIFTALLVVSKKSNQTKQTVFSTAAVFALHHTKVQVVFFLFFCNNLEPFPTHNACAATTFSSNPLPSTPKQTHFISVLNASLDFAIGQKYVSCDQERGGKKLAIQEVKSHIGKHRAPLLVALKACRQCYA